MDEIDEIKRIVQTYNNRAQNSDSVGAAGQWGSNVLAPLICDEIIKKINITAKDKVLEIGCGSGVLGNKLKSKCEFYVGFDASLLMLRKFQNESGKRTHLIQATANSIPLKNNFFDIVVMNGVTMYFPSKRFLEKVLTEIERVSSYTATIFIGENIIASRYYWELVWFQNLSPIMQVLVKPYIRIRRLLANKSSRFAGKWKHAHKDISLQFIKKHFDGKGKVLVTDAAAFTIRQRLDAKNAKGNRRVDLLIKLKAV